MKVAKDLVVSLAYQVRTEDGVYVPDRPGRYVQKTVCWLMSLR